LRARAEEMGLAVATITLFGLAAMFAYPILFEGILNNWLGNSSYAYGMWAGTGIHETAQVIAAASQVDGAVSIASSAKFIRIFMIGPMVLVSAFLFQRMSKMQTSGKIKVAIPWFAFIFICFSLVNYGLNNLPIRNDWASFNSDYLTPAVTILLAWSFAGIGMKVKIATLRSLGLKAFLGGLVVAVLAGITSILLVKYIWLPFN
jgi:uncharacterized integral membrane protein (TIGR00698 family)